METESKTIEDWRKIKELRREKRRNNKEYSTRFLIDRNVKLKSFNGGSLLRVFAKEQYDFWPSTGFFINLKTKEKGRGVRNLYMRVKRKG